MQLHSYERRLVAAEKTELPKKRDEYVRHQDDITNALQQARKSLAKTVTPATIHLAHSPDSDDAFMFYALADGQIETDGVSYVHELQDIETLNGRALRGELDVTAVSIHAYAYLSDRYALLPHGASMGDGYGPMLVATRPMSREDIAGKRIAVPGLMTSAYLALRLFQPDFEPVVVPFDQIEKEVLSGSVEAGLLIHEGQLTYKDHGLHLVADMGAWWLEKTGLPLPLGGNVIRKDMPRALQKQVSRHLRESIAYGLVLSTIGRSITARAVARPSGSFSTKV